MNEQELLDAYPFQLTQKQRKMRTRIMRSRKYHEKKLLLSGTERNENDTPPIRTELIQSMEVQSDRDIGFCPCCGENLRPYIMAKRMQNAL